MTDFKPKVLLVEDAKLAQAAATLILQKFTNDIDVADNGAQALACINEHRYDLIFMDLGLPDMDGFSVTEAIRKQELDGNHVPIVALTAHSGGHVEETCLYERMDEFLVKPLTLENAQYIFEEYSPTWKQV